MYYLPLLFNIRFNFFISKYSGKLVFTSDSREIMLILLNVTTLKWNFYTDAYLDFPRQNT